MPQCVSSDVYLFADDTKLSRDVSKSNEHLYLQNDLKRLEEWANTWLLRFNADKCKTISIRGKSTKHIKYQYSMGSDTTTHVLENVDSEKDIGVFIDSDLSFEKHIQEKINKANKIMGIIRRTYVYLDIENFLFLYKALVRPHLEYCSSVWHPYKEKDIDVIENVQRRATRQIPALKGLTYSERLAKIGLPTLAYRRDRGDMIETFKILNGHYDEAVSNFLIRDRQVRTRGHSQKLQKHFCRLDIRKFSFTNRIVAIWNSLPDYVVIAPSVNSFEQRLDKFWTTQGIKYNYKEKLHTVGAPGLMYYQPDLDIEAERPAPST
ncbi:uncharacterized protein [Ptychodera flava]|uniref:uncharacterized protein n=1 Tax=Ptychodera flava TaxID=63121 RepID=UPI00396A34D8